MSGVVEVAVGLVFNSEGKILIAQRQAWQHQAHSWEFPGGKMEPGESAALALKRELFEEVGILPRRIDNFMQHAFQYSDKSVLLYVQKVLDFEGQAFGKEQQTIKWVKVSELNQFSVPLANQAIVDKLLATNSK